MVVRQHDLVPGMLGLDLMGERAELGTRLQAAGGGQIGRRDPPVLGRAPARQVLRRRQRILNLADPETELAGEGGGVDIARKAGVRGEALFPKALASNIFLPNVRKVNGQLKSAIGKITVQICMITDGLARARNFAAGLKPENGIPVTPVSARKSSSSWREEAK
jgi:hypothetical protein